MRKENPYIPNPATIIEIVDEAPRVKTFTLKFKNKKLQEKFTFTPGQFVQVSIPGVGEAPISISSSPTQKDSFKLCVRAVGNVTNAFHRLNVGDVVWVRGPYGKGFPMDQFKGKNLVFIAGGIGLAPLRSAINMVMDLRNEYGDVKVLYGDRAPNFLLFAKECETWCKHCNVCITVDTPDETWKGHVGVVTKLFDVVEITPTNTVAMMCGPPVMYRFVVKKLLDLGFPEDSIYLSLERRMKCGVGNCRHCMVGSKFVCLDGPVFTFKELKEIPGDETPEAWIP